MFKESLAKYQTVKYNETNQCIIEQVNQKNNIYLLLLMIFFNENEYIFFYLKVSNVKSDYHSLFLLLNKNLPQLISSVDSSEKRLVN